METKVLAIEKFNSRISLVRYSDKKGIISEAKDFADSIINDGADKLMALSVSSKLALFLKTIDSELIPESISEIAKYPDGKGEILGMKLELSETGVSYDYSANQKWVEIVNQIAELDEKRKKMESFIKTLDSKKSEIDEATGEIIEWFPAVKSSTTTIKRTIK